jgi:hypothetical protein
MGGTEGMKEEGEFCSLGQLIMRKDLYLNSLLNTVKR